MICDDWVLDPVSQIDLGPRILYVAVFWTGPWLLGELWGLCGDIIGLCVRVGSVCGIGSKDWS